MTRNLSGKSLWHTHNSCGINACFILGDLNAKVGSQQDGYITGKYGLTKETDRGSRHVEWTQEYDMIDGNTWFQQHSKMVIQG